MWSHFCFKLHLFPVRDQKQHIYSIMKSITVDGTEIWKEYPHEPIMYSLIILINILIYSIWYIAFIVLKHQILNLSLKLKAITPQIGLGNIRHAMSSKLKQDQFYPTFWKVDILLCNLIFMSHILIIRLLEMNLKSGLITVKWKSNRSYPAPVREIRITWLKCSDL